MSDVNPMPGGCSYADAIHEESRNAIKDPLSVFELGCGNGGNLAKFTTSNIRVGIDPSEENITAANQRDGISAILADHTYMENFLTDEFDLGITVSVLNHIPSLNPALNSMMRICSKLILFEPTIRGENRQAKKGESSRYKATWYHDYFDYLSHFNFHYIVRPNPLYEGNSGKLFHSIFVMCEGEV